MAQRFNSPAEVMRRAIELARRGEGQVEPNPQVGAVLVNDELELIAEGWHARFGGPHAEAVALQQAGERARGATLFVTLEPCAHFGKTPPCASAVIAAGVKRVIVGIEDPYPQVAGKGLERLRAAGIEVEVGLLANEVQQLTAPFLKRVATGRPYVHAKWAMSLDGKIAAHTGSSRWISNESSRAIVHRLRARMDAILVGIETVLQDDPLLTPRDVPAINRKLTRIVLDTHGRLPLNCKLGLTARETPVLVIAGEQAPDANVDALQNAGVEVVRIPAAEDDPNGRPDLSLVLDELGRRSITNLLVEGGMTVSGTFFDQGLVDFVHVFIAPKLIGGSSAPSAVGGIGLPEPPALPSIASPSVEILDGDIYISGPVARS